MIAFELVLKIFFGIAVGFFLYKIKLLNNTINSALSRILLEVACPFMIFANIIALSGTDVVPLNEMYSLLLVGVVIYVILVPLSLVITKLLRAPKKSQSVLQCMLLLGNVGFLGLPVAESLFGAIGVFYMALLNIHFNLICFSYCQWIITREAKASFNFSIKSFLNPNIISIILAFILFMLNVRLPILVTSPISWIGGLTSPLSMIVLGASIAAHDLKKIFTQWRLYVLTVIRMIIFPVLTFFIMKAIFGTGTLTSIVTFYLGTPAAVITSMFTVAYGGDEETATSGIAMMNVFCIITVPLMYVLVSQF